MSIVGSVSRVAIASVVWGLLAIACTYDWTVGKGTPDGGEGGTTSSGGPGRCNGTTCDCPTGGDCSLECPNTAASGCDTTCGTGSKCTLSCLTGNCKTTCDTGATCSVSCTGGSCTTTCNTGATCTVECPSGKCTIACDHGTCSFGFCPSNDCTCNGTGCK